MLLEYVLLHFVLYFILKVFPINTSEKRCVYERKKKIINEKIASHKKGELNYGLAVAMHTRKLACLCAN